MGQFWACRQDPLLAIMEAILCLQLSVMPLLDQSCGKLLCLELQADMLKNNHTSHLFLHLTKRFLYYYLLRSHECLLKYYARGRRLKKTGHDGA